MTVVNAGTCAHGGTAEIKTITANHTRFFALPLVFMMTHVK